MAATRIYRIDGQDGPRLVEAKTLAGALAHVAKATLEGRVATQLDLYEAGKAGAVVEKAGEDPQQSLLPAGEG